MLSPAMLADRARLRPNGFGPGLGPRTGLSAPDMDRVCEIVAIPDVIANIDALATAQTYAAVSGPEWRAAKRIGATIAEDLGSIPQIPCGGIQKGPVGPGQSGHQRRSKRSN